MTTHPILLERPPASQFRPVQIITDPRAYEVDRTPFQVCRMCGCDDCNPCPGGCGWVDDDLCSACLFDAEDHGLAIVGRVLVPEAIAVRIAHHRALRERGPRHTRNGHAG